MIIDGILLILQGILNVLLLPLVAVNQAVDFVTSIPVVVEFLQIGAYIIPWTNLRPLFGLIFAILMFKIVLAVIKVIWHFIPLVGN